MWLSASGEFDMREVSVHQLVPEREDEWTRLVEETPGSKIEHTLAWRNAVSRTYPNCTPLYLMAEREGNCVAGFPSFRVQSRLFGPRIISQPFMDNGGVVGKPELPVIKAFADYLRLQGRASYAEIRLGEWMPNFSGQLSSWEAAGARPFKQRGQVILALTDSKTTWTNLDKHARNDVRKAEKSGLYLTDMDLGKELDAFYPLYRRAMHGFGSPHHAREYFTNLFAKLPGGSVRGWNAYSGGKLAGSLLLLLGNHYAYAAFNVSEPSLREARPNDLLYWNAIVWATRQGCTAFDFGQVDDSAPFGSRAAGLLEFKLKWGGKVFSRPFLTLPIRSRASNEQGKSGGFLRHLSAAWALAPAFITNRLGPSVCSQLG